MYNDSQDNKLRRKLKQKCSFINSFFSFCFVWFSFVHKFLVNCNNTLDKRETTINFFVFLKV